MREILMSILVLLTAGVSMGSAGDISARAIEYRDGDAVLEGWLAVPDGLTGKVPSVLIVHDWKGVQEYPKSRAEQLAKLGYPAFVVDIYGQGVRPNDPKECAELAGKYKSDRATFRRRLLAGLEEFRKQPNVDPERIAAIGYCFGGTGVLELARAGADVRGVVSFHGGLDSPNPADGRNIRARVLILHGADDPFVPEAGISALTAELNGAGVDWQMVSYGGAVHSFSNPGAGNDKSTGNAYDAKTDRRSWEHMMAFFRELFGDQP